jgi:hypothetical protein
MRSFVANSERTWWALVVDEIGSLRRTCSRPATTRLAGDSVRISGHSTRVDGALDMVLVGGMRAGRWETSAMVAHPSTGRARRHGADRRA